MSERTTLSEEIEREVKKLYCNHGVPLEEECGQCSEELEGLPGRVMKDEDNIYPLEPSDDAGCIVRQVEVGRYRCSKCEHSWNTYPTECPALRAGAAFVKQFDNVNSDALASQMFNAGHHLKHGDKGKPSFNPKDSVGVKKVPLSTVPVAVMLEVGLAMMEGARKYGRHNYRVIPVQASTYYDAVMARHLPAWWEGEDTDPDSGLSHITKAIASLVVLRDAMIQGTFMDDRPPKSPAGFVDRLNKKAAALVEKYPDPMPAFTELKDGADAISAASLIAKTDALYR